MSNRGPFFTEKARAAAAEARRARAELKVETKHGFEVFVVRLDKGYTWQIRQYGGVIVIASDTTFASPPRALAAGRMVLSDVADTLPQRPMEHSLSS